MEMKSITINIEVPEQVYGRLKRLAKAKFGANTATAVQTLVWQLSWEGMMARMELQEGVWLPMMERREKAQKDARNAARREQRREQRTYNETGMTATDYDRLPPQEHYWEGC